MKKVTTKVDVFSFGIIVMEFLTRKRPTGLSEEDSSLISLRDVVAKAVANGTEQIINIVDPELITKDNGEVLEELFKLSLCCTFSDPEHRPNMNEVLSALVKLKTAR
jgi:LRR receptor-like serine/threonine-protein kinase FLS2